MSVCFSNVLHKEVCVQRNERRSEKSSPCVLWFPKSTAFQVESVTEKGKGKACCVVTWLCGHFEYTIVFSLFSIQTLTMNFTFVTRSLFVTVRATTFSASFLCNCKIVLSSVQMWTLQWHVSFRRSHCSFVWSVAHTKSSMIHAPMQKQWTSWKQSTWTSVTLANIGNFCLSWSIVVLLFQRPIFSLYVMEDEGILLSGAGNEIKAWACWDQDSQYRPLSDYERTVSWSNCPAVWWVANW